MKKILIMFTIVAVTSVSGHPFRMFQSRATFNDTCSICTFIMQTIKDQFDDKHTRDEITEGLHDMCEEIPVIGQKCFDFMSAVVDILAKIDPTDTCAHLSYCKNIT